MSSVSEVRSRSGDRVTAGGSCSGRSPIIIIIGLRQYPSLLQGGESHRGEAVELLVVKTVSVTVRLKKVFARSKKNVLLLCLFTDQYSVEKPQFSISRTLCYWTFRTFPLFAGGELAHRGTCPTLVCPLFI